MMGYMKETPLTQPGLRERMALYVDGQATWPELNGKERCKNCTHFEPTGRVKGRGHCVVRKKLNKHVKATKPYTSEARACRHFAEVA